MHLTPFSFVTFKYEKYFCTDADALEPSLSPQKFNIKIFYNFTALKYFPISNTVLDEMKKWVLPSY